MTKVRTIGVVVVSGLLSSCSATMSQSDETLAPLTSTREVAKNTVVIMSPDEVVAESEVEQMWAIQAEMDYLSFLKENAQIPESVTDEDLLSWADTWCDFMTRGMGKANVVSWINEMADDQPTADLWLMSAGLSVITICPDNAYKWE